MAATTVGPELRPQTLVAAALLQQQLARIVKEEYGKRPMQNAGAIVAFGLRQKAEFIVIAIDQDQLFLLGRYDSVLLVHGYRTSAR
jgi:hypothetical protein